MQKKQHSVLMMDSMRVERTYTGGKLLDEWQGIEPATDALKPEEWIASSTPSRYAPEPTTGLSRIRNDSMKGQFLKDYISKDPIGVLGENHFTEFGENQGFLTKIIDSDKRLNIQTHPDRAQSKILFDSDYGKSEAWYVMGGRTMNGEEPYILMGFKPGMTRKIWQDLVERQDIEAMEKSLHRVPIHKGDVFFIPSGMPHAIGSGCMIAEIQEPTDITFRVEKISHPGKVYPEETYHQGVGYEKMFNCFDYTGYSEEGILNKTKVIHAPVNVGVNTVKTAVVNKEDTPFFSMDKVEIGKTGNWQLDNRCGFASVVILEGKGIITHSGQTFDLHRSNEIFLPCSEEAYSFTAEEGSELKILICYPPGRES